MRDLSQVGRLEWNTEKTILRERKEKFEEVREQAWKSDIDPNVYYTESPERVAEIRINFQEKMKALKEIITKIIEPNILDKRNQIKLLEGIIKTKENETLKEIAERMLKIRKEL